MKGIKWVLGASDFEMRCISACLRDLGETVIPARQGKRRVYAKTAYCADGPDISGRIVTVECGGTFGPAAEVIEQIDHHRPGDNGYGFPPARFLAASSIGQVIQWYMAYQRMTGMEVRCQYTVGLLLDLDAEVGMDVCRPVEVVVNDPDGGEVSSVVIPQAFLYAAAADHCLAAAYAGSCPGVDPGKLAALRDALKSRYSRIPASTVRRHVNIARREILSAPKLLAAGVEVADMRGRSNILRLREVSARIGIPVIYELPAGTRANLHGGAAKLGISGAGEGSRAGSAPVLAFMRGEVPGIPELTDVYGSPARGYAAGFVEAE